MKILETLKNKILKILVRTQRFTGVDHVYLAKGGFWLNLTHAISIVFGLALTIVFTRLVEETVFGQYQFVLAVVATLTFFSLPGADTALMHAVSQGKERSFFLSFKDKLKFSFLGSLALIFLSGYFYFIRNNPSFAILFLIPALFFPIYTTFSIIFSYYYAKKEFRFPSIYQTLIQFFSVFSVLIAIYFTKNILWIVFAYFFVYSLINLILYFLFLKKEKLRPEIDKNVINYGRKLTLINIIPKLTNNFDRLILPLFLGMEKLAIYLIAIKLTDVVKGFINLDSLFFPKLVNLPPGKFLKIIKKFWILLGFFTLIGILILVIPFLILFFFGAKYSESIFLAQAYSIIILPLFIRRLVVSWAAAQKKTRLYFWLVNFFSIGNVALITIFLFFSKTILSVILARIIVASLSAILGLYLIRKEKI